MSDTKPKLEKISQIKLDEKLKGYKQYRTGNAPREESIFDFKQLDLHGLPFPLKSDLREINFSDSDLSGVDLTGAIFVQGDLTDTDFSNAILIDSKFCDYDKSVVNTTTGGATLVGTKFLNAIMHRADLRGTKTAGMQLGGADVTNAKLPDEIKSFDGLKTVEEASKITKRLFTMLLTALGFSVLTILSTEDYLLLTNSATSPLPVIQTPISLSGFYLIAPFLLTVFFIYFLLNLLHLYKLISRLPAVFPDGAPLDEKIFPWLLNTLVREYFPRLPEKEVSLFWVRKLLIVFLIWLATPIVLFWFWFRYLPRHDPWGSGLHIVWVGLVTFFAIEVYNKTIRILKRDPNYEWSFEIHNHKLSLTSINKIAGFFVLIFIVVTFVPGEFNIPKWPNANFAEQDVSHKPDNWNPEKPAEGVKGAMLEHANLDYADARGAFLVKAKLKGASFKHADLSGADLDHADASNAVLVEAKLIGASLKHAILTGAHLTGAKLYGKADLTSAHLNKAHLIEADLTQAFLSYTDFTDANFTGATLLEADFTNSNLLGANFLGANLTNAKLIGAEVAYAHLEKAFGIIPQQIKRAKNWQLAVYDRNFNEKYLNLTDEEISKALYTFIRATFPTLPDNEVEKFREERMEKYRIYYGWPTGEKAK